MRSGWLASLQAWSGVGDLLKVYPISYPAFGTGFGWAPWPWYVRCMPIQRPSACIGSFPFFSINLVITLEPVYGIILAFLIFGQQEVMHAGFYWGTALLLFTVGFHPFLNAKTKA